MMRRFVFTILLLTICSFILAVPREMVVIEVGTGTWCPYCPGASLGTHDLVENGHNVAVIKNQNGDAYANTYSNARNSYYGITSYPTAKFDGVLTYSGGSNTQSLYGVYLPLVNQRLAIPSKYTITAEADYDDQLLTVDVTVTKVEDDSNTNVVLHSSITESNIQHNWQGQTHLHNVNRLMAPSQNGTPVNLSTGESTTITLTFNLSTLWQMPNLELVLWLQNVTSKEILQGKKYSVPGLAGAFPASMTSIDFSTTYIGGVSSVPLRVYNYGDDPITATIQSNHNDFIADTPSIEIDPLQTATVMLHFIPTSEGDITGELTIQGNFPGHSELVIPMSGNAFINTPPIAEDVLLYGPPVYLQSLVGNYSYSDPDGDEEGSTQKRWYRIVEGDPVEITGANDISYQIQESDIGHQIAFGVTPKDSWGMPGELALSEPTDVIINLPAPQNFDAELIPPNTVSLSWERPEYFDGRAFVGYRLYRNGLLISTITTPSVLTFHDTYVADGTHEYWICSLFNNPMMLSEPSPSVFVTVGETSNEDLVNPAGFSINAMPNPFHGQTSLRAKSAPGSEVKISIYNLKGQLVQRYQTHSDANGESSIAWDGKDSQGRIADSGVYLYRAESAEHSHSGKLIKLSK